MKKLWNRAKEIKELDGTVKVIIFFFTSKEFLILLGIILLGVIILQAMDFDFSVLTKIKK